MLCKHEQRDTQFLQTTKIIIIIVWWWLFTAQLVSLVFTCCPRNRYIPLHSCPSAYRNMNYILWQSSCRVELRRYFVWTRYDILVDVAPCILRTCDFSCVAFGLINEHPVYMWYYTDWAQRTMYIKLQYNSWHRPPIQIYKFTWLDYFATTLAPIHNTHTCITNWKCIQTGYEMQPHTGHDEQRVMMRSEIFVCMKNWI